MSTNQVISQLELPPNRLRTAMRMIPGWLSSALAHGVLLVLLALLTVRQVEQPPPPVMVSAEYSTGDDDLVLELLVVQSTLELATVGPEEASLADGAETVSLDTSFVDSLIDTTHLEVETLAPAATTFLDGGFPLALLDATLSLPSGRSGRGAADAKGAATSLFGVKSAGQRFVYVIDNSNSMGGGRLEAAIAEIQNSVGLLKPSQEFYVVFYSDTAYALFYPQTVNQCVPATQANKYRLRDWLATIEHCQQTNGRRAMNMAFDLQPDVIYLLGDGAFTDDTVRQTLERSDTQTVIHTFGFDMLGTRAADGLERIAGQFRGDFHNVTVPPAMLALARQTQRPHNRVRHGAWGIELPAP
jgi:hypothetical protein